MSSIEWRRTYIQTNLEHIRKYSREWQRYNYQRTKEEKSLQRKKIYAFRKEAKRLRDILLD